MKPTQDESAALKRELDGATPQERKRIAEEYPLEYTEWYFERKLEPIKRIG